MAEPFIGEIRPFAGKFAPKGWALCNGQLLPIIQNTALYSILGTMYGGDGKTTFALPNLQGRVVLQQGTGPGLTGRVQGQSGGSATETLITSQMPVHSHVPNCQSTLTPGLNNPSNAIWSNVDTSNRGKDIYTDSQPNALMSTNAILSTGGSQPHNNMQPYLGLNFIIALQGIFPARD
ncbi:phage tail protein [Lysinibacillus sp. BW-2-10]|uniref:phage tail protein n=1 Tax=Lysinibacillus sp. BW-2-10 TaxID=2590030 RepID=UPI001180E855|nr:tail fiber protein [Lysinibacillus sp. BW-2-10]TSI05172.1 phage tail protein [Lysinibacillus sp. BW-2-10]